MARTHTRTHTFWGTTKCHNDVLETGLAPVIVNRKDADLDLDRVGGQLDGGDGDPVPRLRIRWLFYIL